MNEKSFLENYMSDEKNKYADLEIARFVNVLINRRKKLGMTEKELAERIGLERSVISNFESLYDIPSFSVVIRIAKELGLSIKLYSESVRRKRNV